MTDTLYTQAEVDAAIAAAVAPLNDQIAALQQRVAKLSGPVEPPTPVGPTPKPGPADPAAPVPQGSGP